MPAQNTSNITEGTNLYFTNARADARIAAASTSDLSEGTNLYYTDARADARVALIVDSAPGTLNTLNELAAALGDDANFSTTVTNSIATKLPLAGGALTGAVTTNSTFDGRNVSVDGAKLDGIEAGATADQTAAQILTAIKTVDGSGSGLDADLLDGIQGASLVRNDTAQSLTNTINLRASGNHLGNHEFASASGTSTGYSDAGIEIREGAYGGSSAYSAPRIGFHWGGVVASNISIDTAGAILIRNNPGNAYENFRANNIYANGTNTVWHVGNDGSGSGLDADLLDGIQGASFLRSDTLDVMQYNTTSGEMLKFANNTSGGAIQLGFQQNDSDGMHHRFYIKTYKGSASASGNVDLIVRGSGGSITSDILKLYSGNSASWRNNTIWDAGNDGSGSGLDADLLDGQQGSYYAPASHNHSGVYLPISGKAADSNLLDGIDSSSFLRSDAVDTIGARLTMGLQHALVPANYGIGVSGLYSATRYQHVWSMGAAYGTSSDGTSYGNMYGLTWTHTNIGTGANQSIAGLGHQLQLRMNGTLYAAIGSGIWTLNTITSGAQGTLWGSSNDGSGSGLDADLLDGIQASSFLRSDANDSFTGNLTTGADNHITFGPNSSWGSSLRIGGNGRTATGTEMASIVTTDGNIHLDAANSTNGIYLNYYAGTNGTYFGNGAGAIVARMQSNGQLYKSAGSTNPYWNSTNDGSGSGLDADLLDGQQGSYYYPASNPNGYTTNTGTLTSTNDRIYITDTRSASRAPSYYDDRYVQADFTQSTNLGVSGGDSWAAVLTVSKWATYDPSHRQEQLIFAGTKLARRVATSDSGWSSAHTIWDSSTDGSGSGLDADLLDGQNGSYYYSAANPPPTYTEVDTLATVTGRGASTSTALTFNGDTVHSQIRFTGVGGNSGVTNDSYAIYQEAGSWSHPYPDLIIGYHTGIKIGGYTGYGGTRFYNNNPSNGSIIASIGNGDNHLRGYHDGFLRHGGSTDNKIWTAGNDGAGSGLDADLLDGQQGSYYTNPTTLPNGSNLNASYGVTAAAGNGLKFWNGSDAYKISMGNSGEYHYGPVTDYSIKTAIDSNASTRGFTWGTNGGTPIAALNVGNGNMQIGGTFASAGATFTGQVNIDYGSPKFIVGSTSNLDTSDANRPNITLNGGMYPHMTIDARVDGSGNASTNATHGPVFSFVSRLGTSGYRRWAMGTAAYNAGALSFGYYDNNANPHYGMGGNAGYTGTGSKMWLATTGALSTTSQGNLWGASNDGSGSGLDADLLDGSGWLDYGRDIHGNKIIADDWLRTIGNTGWHSDTYGGGWYMSDSSWIRTYGNKNIYQNTGTMRTDGSLQVGSSGSTFLANNGGAVTINSNTVWHAGNDGSGSGLDADLLDGQQGSYYAPASTAVTLAGTHTITGAKYFQSNRNTTSNSPPLQVYSTGNTGAIMSFHRAGYYAVNMGLDSDNVFRIGGWSAATNRFVMDMSGNLTMAGNITAYSDSRLKENVEVIGNALSKVQAMRGVTFTRNDVDDKEERHAGVIAQEVEVVFPEVVSENNEGIKNVAYGNMVGLLIEAVKELKEEVEDLKRQLKEK